MKHTREAAHAGRWALRHVWHWHPRLARFYALCGCRECYLAARAAWLNYLAWRSRA